MPSTCLILVSPSEVTKVINHKNHIDYEFIIPLTPDTYSFLLKTKKFEEKRIIDLSDINFKDLHERIAINLIKYDERIISKVLKEESISKAIRQNLTSELYCFLGSSEYLYSILEKYNKFVFYKQGFNETTDIGTLVSSVMEKLIKNSQGIFSTPSLSKLSNRKSSLVSLNNFLSKIFLKNKKFFVSSGQFYAIPRISNSIKKSKDLLEVQITFKKNKNIFWDLVDVFINFFNFFSKGLLTLYYSPFEESVNSGEHFKKIEKIFLDSSLNRATNQFANISQLIKNQLNFSLGCEKFIKEIFDEDSPLFFLAHQIRWMMMPELAQYLEYKKIPIHLISHGSHSPSNDNHSLNAQKFLANGLLFSDFSNYAYCQSPFALDALGQFTSEKEVRKIFPLMWGSNYSKSKDFKYKKNNSDIFKIIYASTFKPYCLRPTIYETSFELIKSLRALINTVDKLDGFKLTVRMRDEDECSLESLKFLLPRSDNLVFDNSGTFEEQIVRHDCLISFSSTTLEEALSHSIPVCTFTSDSNYRHLEHARSPRLIYNLSKETLKDQLISIKESINNNFQLKSEDKKNILWTEKQAVNFLDFLSKI